MLSYGCLKALFEYHISIPEEVAFAGYDKLEMLDILQLNLTLSEKDAIHMGNQAAGLLLDKISGKQSSNKTILIPDLKIRGSEKIPSKDPNLRLF